MIQILLDNDVVLDFILKRAPFNVEAKEIFDCAGRGEIAIYISAITPNNVFYITRKQIDKVTAFKAVEGLLQLAEVCTTDKSVFQKALTLNFTDFEDAVQCASAMAENVDAIVTRNLKHYKNSPVKIYSPSKFLQFLQTV